MTAIRLLALAALALLLSLPATADAAKKRPLRGQVVGTPYLGGPTKAVVPVLLSRRTIVRAHMRSPLGVLIIKPSKKISTSDGVVTPLGLRQGDRFDATAPIDRTARRAVYLRLEVAKFSVYNRSKELSTTELEALVRQMQAQLKTVSDNVTGMAGYFLARFAGVDTDLSKLRTSVTGLTSGLGSLSDRLDGVQTVLDEAKTDLRARIDTLIRRRDGPQGPPHRRRGAHRRARGRRWRPCRRRLTASPGRPRRPHGQPRRRPGRRSTR